ncbi:SagB family peptide dehydrogenase [Rathayibacter iranicus]|uniref:SagB family peptide dehydrogenase n=1 Tax=Rathayibacter iranicus TaxID=59737 RepID=UPI0015E46ED3|nr:SagB family peptide dehydrogenase [Rathayibacter iranicus]
MGPLADRTQSEPAAPVRGRAPSLGLRPGVAFAVAGDGRLTVSVHGTPVARVSGLSSALSQALADLESGATSILDEESLAGEFARLPQTVRGCVLTAVRLENRTLALAEPLRAGEPPSAPVALEPGDLVRSSRFAYSHRQNDELLVESPVAGARIIVLDDSLGLLLAATAQASRVETLERRLASVLPAHTVREILELMLGVRVLEVAERESGEFPSDSDPVLRQWDFHDLLFHSRSRFGRTAEPFGGIFPHRGRIEPRSAVRECHAGQLVELPAPSFDDVLERDPSLLMAMETRHSCRTFGEQPLTLDELGEFLFRSARVSAVREPGPGLLYQASHRPYPTGGAAYELELYLTVRRVAGLEPGSYHYEPDVHRLRRLDTADADRDALLAAASLSAGGDVHPDVLLTITSRFQRLQWKYRSIAYAVSLKHVGVLYQTMYLVASAMSIGACGLGSGDSEASVRAFGLDYLEESSVGEFLLGSAPSASRPLPSMGEENDQVFPGADWGFMAARARGEKA